MNNINYDSFYIFCVSIGIVLIAVPVIILFLLNANDLPLITKQNYIELVDQSRVIVDKTQEFYRYFINVYLILSIILILLGIIALVYGIYKWYKKQKTIDKFDEGKVLEQSLNIQKMSKEDINKKIEAEDKRIKHNTKSEFYKIKKFESNYYEYLTQNKTKTYLKDIKISNYSYDIVEISNNYTNDIIYEIKHWYDTPSSTNLISLNKTLAKMKNDYYNVRSKKAGIVLVIDSLGIGVFDYSIIKKYLTEIDSIVTYGNGTNDLLASFNMKQMK